MTKPDLISLFQAQTSSDETLHAQGNYLFELTLKAWHEAQKAMLKYPQPNYVLTKVAEEAGEVVKAGVHAAEGRMPLEEVEKEAVQAIAMIFRVLVEGDGYISLPPQKKF